MSRLQGQIDFSHLPTTWNDAVEIVRGEHLHQINLPGLNLRWHPREVSVAISNGVLAIATGRSRDSTLANLCGRRAEAALWIERYRRHGEDCAAEIGGGFAVVLVEPSRRCATLLVDRFSIETLCYRECGGTLSFSDSCRDVPGSSHEFDPQSLFDYLYHHVIPAPQTIFRDVRRLEHAHCLVVDIHGGRPRPYWTPHFIEDDRRDFQGRKRAFVDAVQRSVDEEADDQNVACFLSGGTDSSTIAGMLRKVRGQSIDCYSIGFESQGYDEMEYARLAARHFQLVHHEYYVTADDLVDAIPTVAASLDQPFGNSSILPAYYCALRARADGFTRLLAGDGGDELYGGNARYATQKVFEIYRRLPGSLRRSVLEPAANSWSLFRAVPGFRRLGGYVRHSSVPMPDRMETFNLLQRLGESSILAPDYLARIDPERALAQQRQTWNNTQATSLLNRMLAYDWKYTLADNDLPKVRGATQLAEVSVGYPFLSRELADLSLRLPPDWKLKGMNLRWFFKEALCDFLPNEILAKKKHGFGLPFGPWCVRHARLQEFTVNSVNGLVDKGVIAPTLPQFLFGKLLPEAPGYYGELAWILVMLDQWLEHSTVLGTLPG